MIEDTLKQVEALGDNESGMSVRAMLAAPVVGAVSAGYIFQDKVVSMFNKLRGKQLAATASDDEKAPKTLSIGLIALIILAVLVVLLAISAIFM